MDIAIPIYVGAIVWQITSYSRNRWHRIQPFTLIRGILTLDDWMRHYLSVYDWRLGHNSNIRDIVLVSEPGSCLNYSDSIMFALLPACFIENDPLGSVFRGERGFEF